MSSGLRCWLASGAAAASWCCSSAMSFKLCSGTTLWRHNSREPRQHKSEIHVEKTDSLN
jgi:hypothetical protein